MYGGALSIKELATTSTVPPAPGPPWRLPEATATVQTCSVLACLQRSSRRGTRRAYTLKHANGAGSVRGSSVVVREEYCRSMLSSVRRGGVAVVWRNSVPEPCVCRSLPLHITPLLPPCGCHGVHPDLPILNLARVSPAAAGGRGATPARVARVPRRHVGRRPRLSFSWDILPPLPGSIYGTSCCVAAPRVSATLPTATVLLVGYGAVPQSWAMWM